MLSDVLLDDTDDGCPECGAGVSATAVYCMDCGADLDAATEAGGDTARADPPTPGAAVAGSDAATAETSGTGFEQTLRGDESRGLLHPEGIVDNSLTVVVGVVGGTVAGLLTLVLVGLASQHWLSVAPALAVWAGGIGYLSRRRTVGDAVQKTCYGVATLLVLFPVISFAEVTKGGTVGGRIVLFLIGELAFGLFAALIAGVGYYVGNR